MTPKNDSHTYPIHRHSKQCYFFIDQHLNIRIMLRKKTKMDFIQTLQFCLNDIGILRREISF